MFHLATITLTTPVTIYLPEGRRRVAGPATQGTVPETIASLEACFVINPVTRTIHAQLAPIPSPLLLYGPADFVAACTDTPEQHAERVRSILGRDPAVVLQALCDGLATPPPPPRVPPEIPNWRCKAVLGQMGLLGQVETILAALPEPEKTIVKLSWQGDGKVARRGKTVLSLAAALGLSEARVDAMFIAAEGIEV
jgi:hypothetical protein